MAERSLTRSAGDPHQDWPLLLNANVAIRSKEGTRAWMTVRDTKPSARPQLRLKASFESPKTERSYAEAMAILEVMISQIRKQFDAYYAEKCE